MKNKIWLLLLLSLICTTQPVVSQVYLKIKTIDDNIHSYKIDENLKMAFQNNEIIVRNKEIANTFVVSNIKKICFSTYDTSDIMMLNSYNCNNKVSITGESIVICNYRDNSIVRLFMPNGLLISEEIVPNEGFYYYSTSHLKSGVYILEVNEIRLKFVKK